MVSKIFEPNTTVFIGVKSWYSAQTDEGTLGCEICGICREYTKVVVVARLQTSNLNGGIAFVELANLKNKSAMLGGRLDMRKRSCHYL